MNPIHKFQVKLQDRVGDYLSDADAPTEFIDEIHKIIFDTIQELKHTIKHEND
tara:strand:- start:134 stop:292 length:159 start_codon:yes stop_codon:yes gene_type:complete